MDAQLNIDLDDLVKAEGVIKRRARNLKKPFSRLSLPMKSDQKANFARREGPEGKWPPLAAETRGRKGHKKRRGQTAGRTKTGRRRKRAATLGLLKQAFVIQFGKQHLIARSTARFANGTTAEIHQDGGVAGHGAQIPARTHLWMSAQFIERALKEIRNYIVEKA